jgi:transposase
MKKTRQRYDRAFKISVVAELGSGKPLAQIAREHSIHPGLPSRWRDELAENPEKAFSGNGNQYKDQARIAELERLLGQAHAEIELLKKSLRHDPKEGSGGENKTDAEGRQWEPRSPAMAAGITDHIWTIGEIMMMLVVPESNNA